MRVAHYLEFEQHISGGIRESVCHQRRMLSECEIEYTTTPTLDADILHCNLMGPRSIFYAIQANQRNVPVIAHTHVTAEDFRDSFRFSTLISRPLKPYLKRAYSLADVLICPSEYNRSIIESYTDAPTTVISNGVDLEKLTGFELLRETYRERYNLSGLVVFTVGHVFPRKGLETFVETARRLPDVEFVWFGPLDRRLKARETRQIVDSAPSNCTFTGYIEDIRGAYAAGDVFFCPTREENEGIALLEALATGQPMVVRDIPAFSWLEDGTHCLKANRAFDATIDQLRDRNRPDSLSAIASDIGGNASNLARAYAVSNLARDLQACYREVIECESGISRTPTFRKSTA